MATPENIFVWHHSVPNKTFCLALGDVSLALRQGTVLNIQDSLTAKGGLTPQVSSTEVNPCPRENTGITGQSLALDQPLLKRPHTIHGIHLSLFLHCSALVANLEAAKSLSVTGRERADPVPAAKSLSCRKVQVSATFRPGAGRLWGAR